MTAVIDVLMTQIVNEMPPSPNAIISQMHHSTVRAHTGLSCPRWRHYPGIVQFGGRLAKLAACQRRKQHGATSLLSHYVDAFSCRRSFASQCLGLWSSRCELLKDFEAVLCWESNTRFAPIATTCQDSIYLSNAAGQRWATTDGPTQPISLGNASWCIGNCHIVILASPVMAC